MMALTASAGGALMKMWVRGLDSRQRKVARWLELDNIALKV